MLTAKTRRLLFLLMISGTLMFSFLAIEHFHDLNRVQLKREKLNAVQLELTELRANLETEINTAIFNSWALVSYIIAHPNSGPDNWAMISESVFDPNSTIRAFTAAPDNVINFVYPLKGNEAALGLVYANDPSQADAAARVRKIGKVVLAGPFDLLQGGRGLVARVPVYSHVHNEDAYWGVVAVVIDIKKLYQTTGLTALLAKYEIAIRGQDGLGSAGEIFLGTDATFKSFDFTEFVNFVSGSWQLAVKTNIEQSESFWRLQRVRLLGYPFVCSMYLILFTLFVWYRTSYMESMHDPLTNVANRRALVDRLQNLIALNQRQSMPFALILIDIDAFKAINDTRGHTVGDLVLRTTAERLEQAIRESDTVARIGGDEFIVVLLGIDDPSVVQMQCDKVLEAIEAPIIYQKNKISISASLGWSLFPQDGLTIDALMQNADAKMYKKKQEQ